ncbi:hypothetical protein [Falsiroseomonas sp. CW058]|uniref:hypothetical protein n=1 Tax=Falsiroseomonas sp. CW058 TaxID=3388664 RepID=UPI003D320145
MRLDELGVEWVHEERADEIDDKWQVLVYATVRRGPSRDFAFGVLCVADTGRRVSIELPDVVFGGGNRRELLIRADSDPAFTVTAIGRTTDQHMADIEGARLVWALSRMLASARERIVVRDVETGRTFVLPLGPARPEANLAADRCEELRRPRS